MRWNMCLDSSENPPGPGSWAPVAPVCPSLRLTYSIPLPRISPFFPVSSCQQPLGEVLQGILGGHVSQWALVPKEPIQDQGWAGFLPAIAMPTACLSPGLGSFTSSSTGCKHPPSSCLAQSACSWCPLEPPDDGGRHPGTTEGILRPPWEKNDLGSMRGSLGSTLCCSRTSHGHFPGGR